LTGPWNGPNHDRQRRNDREAEFVLLTFDDGGVSCHGPVADVLDRMGWRGHFFVPTDLIGRQGS